MGVSFSEAWSSLSGGLDRLDRELVEALKGAWSQLAGMAGAAIGEQRPKPTAGATGRIEAFAGLWGPPDAGQAPNASGDQYVRVNPFRHAVHAFEERRTRMDEIVQALPETVKVSDGEILEATGRKPGWLGRGGKPWDLEMRALAAGILAEQAARRARIESRLLRTMARAALLVCEPWKIHRREYLRQVSGQNADWEDLEKLAAQWRKAIAKLETAAGRAIGRLEASLLAERRALDSAIWSRSTPPTAERHGKWLETCQEHATFWAVGVDRLDVVVHLDLLLDRMGREAIQTAAESLEMVERQHAGLLGELSAAVEWLRESGATGSLDGFPAPQTKLAAAEERADAWVRALAAQCARILPEREKTFHPRISRPGRKAPWRDVTPRMAFLESLRRSGRRAAIRGFESAESRQRRIVEAVENAREVVRFGGETEEKEGAEARGMLAEAAANAASLLEYERDLPDAVRQTAEEWLVRANALVFLNYYARIEQGRLGLLAFLAGQSSRALSSELVVSAMRAAPRVADRSREWAGEAYVWVLRKVGWLAPPQAVPEPVVRRPDLAQTLELELPGVELPRIYHRLFRLAPVDDPRFLVGRERELAAWEKAYAEWRAGRALSVIVVGGRGSGKTSLVNCALQLLETDVPVIRGAFRERLTTARQIDAFLATLLEAPESEVAARLREGRRIVIIEELERTFLRSINGFEAIRALLELVALTSRSTFWAFTINHRAFDYLSAALGLGRYFAYRINAMSVEKRDLKSAILVRHNLSGLRLVFSEARETAQGQFVRRLLGKTDPKEEFFDTLYVQSGGLLRAAFHLWQRSIEHAVAGVLYMKPLEELRIGPLIRELNQEALFSLQAIMQHGSMTPEEHARVFGVSVQASETLLEGLRVSGLIEPDPQGPGLRVRPEGGQVVHQALHRHNLL